MLTDEQLESLRAKREGPYGWRDCPICGNFVMPGEPECPSMGCAMVRVSQRVAEKAAAEREANALAVFCGITPPGPSTSPLPHKTGSDSSE